MSVEISRESGQLAPTLLASAQSLRALRRGGELYDSISIATETQSPPRWRRGLADAVIDCLKRRWARERRRRKVGRAYDMALEIARVVPKGSEVLDVGCGNGYIAHHLSAMLGTTVTGIDVTDTTEAQVDYHRYDGKHFPLPDNSVDAVLFGYVLHHAQDVRAVLDETRRVLRPRGTAIIYEDIPETWWDKGVCGIHNRQWKDRTGPCTFRNEVEWRNLFESVGFEISTARALSRWRNFAHPVQRISFVLRRPYPVGVATA